MTMTRFTEPHPPKKKAPSRPQVSTPQKDFIRSHTTMCTKTPNPTEIENPTAEPTEERHVWLSPYDYPAALKPRLAKPGGKLQAKEGYARKISPLSH